MVDDRRRVRRETSVLDIVRPGSRPPGVPTEIIDAGPVRYDSDSLDRPTIERRASERQPIAVIDDLATARLAGAVVAAQGSAIAIESRRISPAAARLLNTAIDELRERLGDVLIRATEPVDPVYLGDGRASVLVCLTFSVEDLNHFASLPAKSGT